MLHNVVAGVLPISGQFSSAIAVPECARLFAIVFSPSPCSLKVFVVVIFVPLLSACRNALFVGSIPSLPHFLSVLAFAVFTLVLCCTLWMRFGIGGGSLKILFSVLNITSAISLQLPVTVKAIVSSTHFSRLFGIAESPLSAIFAALFFVSLPINTPLGFVPFRVSRIPGFIEISRAGFAFVSKAVFGIRASTKVLWRGGELITAEAASFCVDHDSILTNAGSLKGRQPGGVSSAFPVANGRLPVQTDYIT